MQLWEGVRLALAQIRAQKLKSVFSVLGVIIGVMFLIVVVNVVEGMDRYIREDVSSFAFGVNTITLSRRPSADFSTSEEELRRWSRHPRVTFDDVDAVRERLSIPARIAIENGTGGELSAEGGRKVEQVFITAASPEIFQVRNLVVERGRPFSAQEAERGVAVVVLGTETATILFQGTDPIGRKVRIRGFPYRVVGVLEEQGSLFGQSLDNRAIAPALSPLRSFASPRGMVDDVLIQTVNPEDIPAALNEIEAIMRIRRRLRPSEPNNFAVETADDALSFWNRISQILFIALPGLVGISLVVGGIVIMNIMLVSVMERTREIGVRKAIGARRKDILLQVLIESATLSATGALIGIGVGIGLTSVVAAVSPLPAAVAPRWIVLGVLLGLIVGIIAGVFPASRASKLDPVDALRYE